MRFSRPLLDRLNEPLHEVDVDAIDIEGGRVDGSQALLEDVEFGVGP
jgi:hypothetical protein